MLLSAPCPLDRLNIKNKRNPVDRQQATDQFCTTERKVIGQNNPHNHILHSNEVEYLKQQNMQLPPSAPAFHSLSTPLLLLLASTLSLPTVASALPSRKLLPILSSAPCTRGSNLCKTFYSGQRDLIYACNSLGHWIESSSCPHRCCVMEVREGKASWRAFCSC